MASREARCRVSAHAFAHSAAIAAIAGIAAGLPTGCKLASPAGTEQAAAGAPAELPLEPPPDAPVGPQPRKESELVVSIVRLADAALARGELDVAEQRYRRALSMDPRSPSARLGLIAVFNVSGREEEASVWLAKVLETAAGAQRADALTLLAEAEIRRGRGQQAQRALSLALALDDDRYNVHQQLADLTGLAPRTAAESDDEALQRASDHPYDPAALLAGARVRLARGDESGAVEWLENAVWLADVDLESSRRASRLLSQTDKAWKRRTIVQVHVYADESVRREAGWRMRMRLVWRSASTSLDPLLRVAFVPVTIERFQSARHKSDLESIAAGFYESVRRVPSHGLMAVLTDRPVPRRRGSHQLGFAEFLGRELVARLTPGEIPSRTLIHEVLHIYGGVHVASDFESLMNPGGDSLKLDPGNQAIAFLLRDRLFGPGGIEANVLPHVEADRLIAVYLETLRVNLGLRQRGVSEARSEMSRYVAAALGRRALKMDSHLGDVSRITGYLMARTGHTAEAAKLYEAAAQLYGPSSRRGQKMAEVAANLLEAAAEQSP